MSERLQLKITLDEVTPTVWRRVVVSDALNFAQLHKVIQRAMGWDDCHLYEFKVGEARIAMAGQEAWNGESTALTDTQEILSSRLAGEASFRYWYDLGDSWWHTIAIEKRLPAESADAPAALLAGENACPPEDCGGPWGYMELLVAQADPDHPEHERNVEWLGDFDAAEFNLAEHARFVTDMSLQPPFKRREAPPK